MKALTPVLDVDGKSYVILTPQLTSISNKQLGAKVANLAGHRDEIMAALDLLITGI